MKIAIPRPLYVLLVMLFLVACATDGGVVHNPEFQVLFEKGRAYMRRGNARMALPALQDANRLHPGHVPLLRLLGVAYDQVERPLQALATLEEAHQLQPESGELNNNLGVARMRLLEDCSDFRVQHCRQVWGKAEEAFVQALQDKSLTNPEEVWFNRALLYKRRDYLRQMVRALQRSLAINARYLPARMALIDYYGEMQRPYVQQDHLRLALRFYPDNVVVMQRLAQSLTLTDLWDMTEVRSILKHIGRLAPGTHAAKWAAERLIRLDEKP